MPVDIIPLMDSPWWKSAKTPAQRKKVLDIFQDPNTSEEERVEILREAQQPLPSEPSGAARVVSSVGGMLKEVPGLAYNTVMAPMVRAGGQDPATTGPYPGGQMPQTPQEWEARLLPMQQNIEKGTSGVLGLMAGPALGRAGYKAGETILSKLTPALANSPVAQTVANALPAVGEAGGNYLSRQANVAMGTEQPGVGGDVASAALPLLVRGATSKPALSRAPGAGVAQHEMAAADIHRGVERMQPSTSAETLYGVVAQQHNPSIPVHNLRQTTQDIIARELREGRHTQNSAVLGIAQELDDLAKQHGDNVPMDLLYERMQRIGERLRGAERTDNQGTRELSRLYAGFHDALENASQSNIPGAETLQQAIKASRQEHAVERLQRITGEGRGITTQTGTGFTLVSGKKMLNEFNRLLADDDVFRGSFTAEELADMRSVFEGANKVPALPVPGKVPVGSKQMLLRGAVAAPIGYAIAGPEGATMATSAAMAAPEVISRLMTTNGGRAMLKAAFEGRDIIKPDVLAVLNQAARQGPEVFTSKRASTSPE